MSDVYYEDKVTKITSNQLIHGKTTIPLTLIADTRAFTSSFEFGAFVTNVIGVVIGLWLLSLLSLWSLLGIPVLALCGWNVYNMLTVRESHLSIDLHNGDTFRLTAKSRALIDEIDSALQRARTAA
jgi:hypothetical protein